MAHKVPFLDLVAHHREYEEEFVTIVRHAIHTAGFIGGENIEKFENEFAAFCNTKYCVALNSGTDALRFALIGAHIGAGDIVITVPHTFIATTEAISQSGAEIGFVDIDPKTYTLDPKKFDEYLKNECTVEKGGYAYEKKSHKRIAAIIPVHLYGHVAAMDEILNIANQYRILVIEDACQAHGAMYHSTKDKKTYSAGSIGYAAAFSFYPGKNLGALGDGGALTTNDPELALKVKKIRDHGQAQKYIHDIEGYNGRLDAIQAGFLRLKLKNLSRSNSLRAAHARTYSQRITAAEHCTVPYNPPWSESVYHLYIVLVKERQKLIDYLSDHGIGTGLHYPIPLHLQKAYAFMNVKEGTYPVAEKVASMCLSLPMYPELQQEQIEYVAHMINEYYQKQ